MSNATFIHYQRLELQSMSTEQLLNIIRIAANNYPDTSLILTPRIDQSGQAYYWTGYNPTCTGIWNTVKKKRDYL